MIQPVGIDLNADLGEFPDEASAARDAELMHHITTANIACGGHAGDERTIRRTIASAIADRVAVGAHPGYPDRVNCGRVEMDIAPAALEISLVEQVKRVADIAHQLGVAIRHVKPHGALYHSANQNPETARTIGRAVLCINPGLIVLGQYGSQALETYQKMGLRTAAEAFVDRRYERDGTLRNRKLAGALLESAELAAEQAIQIARRRSVMTLDSTLLPIEADTICLHSDTPESVKIAQAVRARLVEAGVQVRSLI